MRPLLPGDLDDGVRALLAVAPRARPAAARGLIRRARNEAASLSSVARRAPLAPLPGHCDRDYRACLALLLAACARARLP